MTDTHRGRDTSDSFHVFDLHPNMVYVLDRDYRVVYQNRKHAEYYGGHNGEPCYKVHSHNESSCPECPVNGTFTDSRVTTRIKQRTDDGEKSYHEIVSFPIAGPDGGIRYAVNISRDITLHKQTEEDLLLFRTLINQSNDALLIVDPVSSRILYVNDKVCTNLGYECRELLGLRIVDIAMNVQDMDAWQALVLRVKRDGFAMFETEQKRRDGASLPLEINARLITHENREFLVSVARDISERKRAEEALLAEKNKLEAVISAMGDGITLHDRNFRILYQNTAHREMQGAHIGELCYEAYHRKERICDGCLLLKSFEDGKVHQRETSAMTDAGLIYLEITAAPLRDARGDIVAGIEVVRNTTERKKLETQLIHAQKMEAVGHLAGGIAHDFNNILTAVMGYGSLVQMKLADDNPLQTHMEQLLSSAERAAHLTQRLLAFSRKQVINPQAVNLNECVMKVQKLLIRLIGEDIEFTTNLAVSALTVMADQGQLEQVLMNLATNARDAMPKGGTLTIRTESVVLDEELAGKHDAAAAGQYALLSVADTGLGIDERTREKIFEPFFTTKGVGKGSGLGLSIVYGIVKQHKGFINVESAPRQGSRFNIYLPMIAGEAEAAVRNTPQRIARGAEMILIAEDEEVVRMLTKQVLEEFGYAVIEACNGAEAVERFLENQDRIELVLLDVIMPKMNGKEACERIKAVRPGIKTLFMSGYTDDILDKKGSLDQQMNFLSKPFSPELLLRKVREVLG